MKRLRMLALALCISMVVTNPNIAYASQSQNEICTETENGVVPEGISSNNEPETENENVSSNEVQDEQDTVVSENNSISENNTVSSNDEEKTGFELYNFHEMKLTGSMVQEKSELKSIANSLSKYKQDVDYKEHEAVYMSDTKSDAEKIAACYNATLVDYDYGIATIQFEQTVEDVIQVAADMSNSLPAIYPNAIYYAYEETDAKIISENALKDPVFVNEEEEKVGHAKPSDPGYSSQWFHDFVDSLDAWDTKTGEGVTVAVLDTGADTDHPDLVANLLPGIDTTKTSAKAEDGNGHGTHVSGIISAPINGIGGVGVAPSAKILPIKVLTDKGISTGSSVAQGIRAAIQNKADVINMSLGGLFYDALEQKVINEAANAGIVIVCAAGNESVEQKSYPAAYDNTIAVAALGQNGEEIELAFYSNWGDWVDIAAPGSGIYSTYPSGTYKNLDGTSMACPVVAGVVALIKSSDAKYRTRNINSVNEVKNILLSSVKEEDYEFFGLTQDDGTSYVDRYVYGGVDSSYALDTATLGNSLAAPTFKPDAVSGNGIVAGIGHELTISTNNSRAKIYYTYNGKEPSPATGYLYKGPLSLQTTGKYTFKAVAYVGNRKSNITTYKADLIAKATAVTVDAGKTQVVAPGKKIQLLPDFTPSYTTNKGMDWKSGNSKITVDAKGQVSCTKDATASDSTTITGTTKDGSNIMVSVKVNVVSTITTKLEIKKKDATLTLRETAGTNEKAIFRTYNVLSDIVSEGGPGNYIFTSANKKVAVVDSKGLITAVGKGKTTITIKANDGSNKSVKFTVNCIMPTYKFDTLLSSTGFYEDGSNNGAVPIANGVKIKITPYLNDDRSYYNKKNKGVKKPNNSKVIWTSDNSGVTVKNGVVCCSKDAYGTAKITATAADGFGAVATMTFKVYENPKELYISNLKKSSARINFKVSGYIYKSNLTNSLFIGNGKACPNLRCNISNKDVANYIYTDYGWILVGMKPGTCKITYTTIDGTNKKVTFNVTVK